MSLKINNSFQNIILNPCNNNSKNIVLNKSSIPNQEITISGDLNQSKLKNTISSICLKCRAHLLQEPLLVAHISAQQEKLSK